MCAGASLAARCESREVAFRSSFLLLKAPFRSPPPGAQQSSSARLDFSFGFQTRGLVNKQPDLSPDSISYGVGNVPAL